MGATNIIVFAVGWAAFLAIAYRQSKRPVAGPDRIPKNWTWTAVFALILGYVLEHTAIIFQIRMVEVSEIGKLANLQIYGGLAVHTCVFVAIAVLMWRLSEPKPTSAVETTS